MQYDRKILLIAHNLRSCHNVGSLLRTAEGLGAGVILSGYTPYPKLVHDTRLPHEISKVHNQIHKTALGAEDSADWEHLSDVKQAIEKLKIDGYEIAALEQTDSSVPLPDFKPHQKVAIVVGREVDGLEKDVIEKCDVVLEIPMAGKKESFNVAQAAAMALYHSRFSYL